MTGPWSDLADDLEVVGIGSYTLGYQMLSQKVLRLKAGLTPATPESWPPNLGWLGSRPKGDAPRGFRSEIAPDPWFPGRLATPKMFTAVVRRPAPNHGRVGRPARTHRERIPGPFLRTRNPGRLPRKAALRVVGLADDQMSMRTPRMPTPDRLPSSRGGCRCFSDRLPPRRIVQRAGLVLDQPSLEIEAAAIAGQRPVRPDDAVAGDDDGDRVASIRGPDRAEEPGRPIRRACSA